MDKDKTLLASVNAFSEENDKLHKELEQLRSVIKDKDSLIRRCRSGCLQRFQIIERWWSK